MNLAIFFDRFSGLKKSSKLLCDLQLFSCVFFKRHQALSIFQQRRQSSVQMTRLSVAKERLSRPKTRLSLHWPMANGKFPTSSDTPAVVRNSSSILATTTVVGLRVLALRRSVLQFPKGRHQLELLK